MIRVILILLVVVVFLSGERTAASDRRKICMEEQRKPPERIGVLTVVKQIFSYDFPVDRFYVNVKGFENKPDKPVLYVGNHRSYFDISERLYCCAGARLGLCGQKRKWKKFPLLRDLGMRNERTVLFLDRKDIKQV